VGDKSFVSGRRGRPQPNIGWDRTPEQAANTDPEFVVAVAEMCLAAGARSVHVFDRTCNDARRCYVNSGVKDAVEQFARKNRVENALRIYHVEDRKFVRTSIRTRCRSRSGIFTGRARRGQDRQPADRQASLAGRHHARLKNMMGSWAETAADPLPLPECLVDIHRRVPVALTVIDAGGSSFGTALRGSLADVKSFGKAFASRTWSRSTWSRRKDLPPVATDVGHIGKAWNRPGGFFRRADPLVEG